MRGEFHSFISHPTADRAIIRFEKQMTKFPRLKLPFLAAALIGIILGSSPLLAQENKESGGEPAVITGEFELIDPTGKLVASKDFRGRYMLVFLGYTFCPDICPTDLQVMTEALELMGHDAEKIQPIFITIDPARDTPKVMGEYVSHFHPRLIGLTGDAKQVDDATRSYGAKFYKVFAPPMQNEDDSDDSGGNSMDEDYLINHSAATYLIGPDGQYIGHFSQGSEAQGMADQLSQIIP